MTKAELIERYGVEWYEAYKARTKARNKERYHNDPEFREYKKAKDSERNKERYANDPEFRKTHIAKDSERKKVSYCRPGEFELIENYELAKADNFKGWDIHHRLELTLNDEYAHSKEELKRMDMYYNRPYFELIFLRHSDHTKLHNKARR